jgi:hypothetical protein
MSGFWRRLVCIFGVVGSLAAAPAGAQENLDSGKSGAQLFASNCALCHKSAQALRKSGGVLGLSDFLREHYTSSRESAAIIATYLESLGTPPAPGKRTGATKRTVKGDEKVKVDEKKGKPKSGESQSVEPDKTGKPSEIKTSGPKTSEPKTEPKSELKPPDGKASEPKPDAAPAIKPDKPEKPD